MVFLSVEDGVAGEVDVDAGDEAGVEEEDEGGGHDDVILSKPVVSQRLMTSKQCWRISSLTR
jgi:hypothetical protein